MQAGSSQLPVPHHAPNIAGPGERTQTQVHIPSGTGPRYLEGVHQAGKLCIKCILSSDLYKSTYTATYKARSQIPWGTPPKQVVWGEGASGSHPAASSLPFPPLAPSCTVRRVPWMHVDTLPSCPSFMLCCLQTPVPQGCAPHCPAPLLGRWTQAAGTRKSGSGLWVTWQGISRFGYLNLL